MAQATFIVNDHNISAFRSVAAYSGLESTIYENGNGREVNVEGDENMVGGMEALYNWLLFGDQEEVDPRLLTLESRLRNSDPPIELEKRELNSGYRYLNLSL